MVGNISNGLANMNMTCRFNIQPEATLADSDIACRFNIDSKSSFSAPHHGNMIHRSKVWLEPKASSPFPLGLATTADACAIVSW